MKRLKPLSFSVSWLRVAVVLVVVAVAIAWRLLKLQLDIPWNLELITATAFLAAALLPRALAPLAPLLAVVVSDILLGNEPGAAWFTWTAWAIIGLGSLLTARWKGLGRWVASGVFGISATLFFYLYTNFGFWVMYPEYYAPGWEGLFASYIAGIPFLQPQLIGNLILVPLVGAGLATLVEAAEARSARAPGVVAG